MTVGSPLNSYGATRSGVLLRTGEQLVDDKAADSDDGECRNPANDTKQQHPHDADHAALYPADQLRFRAGLVDILLGVQIGKIDLGHQGATKCGFSMSPTRFPNGSATVATRMPCPTS